MKVEVHILCFNEEEILPYTLRHYRTFADVIVVHDAGSTDRSIEIAATAGGTVTHWDTKGQLNDQLAMELKNSCWRGTDADWVICADADELIYFPQGAVATLSAYDEAEVAVAKPHGWEMYSDVFPTGSGQIYEEVKTAAKEERWYSKPILFSPHRVKEMNFSPGAHRAAPVLADSRAIPDPVNFSFPVCWLLHCKHLGPIERIADRYAAVQKRLAPINRKHRWGNFDPPMTHARDKRQAIVAKLQQLFM